MAAISCIEALHKIALRSSIRLSVQQLLDCIAQVNKCGSESPVKAYQYVIRNHGIASERDYPFTGMYPYDGYGWIYDSDIMALKKAVSRHPVCVMIESNLLLWQHTTGVYRYQSETTNLNHFVTLMGYDETETKEDYWIAQNSWGKKWGEGGYFKLKMHHIYEEGCSGVERQYTYPILKGFNLPLHAPLKPHVLFNPCTCKTCVQHLFMTGKSSSSWGFQLKEQMGNLDWEIKEQVQAEISECASYPETLLLDNNTILVEEPKSVYVGGDHRVMADTRMLMGGGESFSAGKGKLSQLYLHVLNEYPAFNSIYNNTAIQGTGTKILTFGERKHAEYFLKALDQVSQEDITFILEKAAFIVASHGDGTLILASGGIDPIE
ncbi:hypothetical protein L1987_53213 [Smallanthus sonchifolius]|uniref:Uncharacterized protein n=1 Tax=Smallanthus sonchifolius TaxID=185202 RepID=A0ACB9EVB1_9ASTR|nr:hypothetical protein L1987_53213 [Smallanthus sonchifolius]